AWQLPPTSRRNLSEPSPAALPLSMMHEQTPHGNLRHRFAVLQRSTAPRLPSNEPGRREYRPRARRCGEFLARASPRILQSASLLTPPPVTRCAIHLRAALPRALSVQSPLRSLLFPARAPRAKTRHFP